MLCCMQNELPAVKVGNGSYDSRDNTSHEGNFPADKKGRRGGGGRKANSAKEASHHEY